MISNGKIPTEFLVCFSTTQPYGYVFAYQFIHSPFMFLFVCLIVKICFLIFHFFFCLFAFLHPLLQGRQIHCHHLRNESRKPHLHMAFVCSLVLRPGLQKGRDSSLWLRSVLSNTRLAGGFFKRDMRCSFLLNFSFFFHSWRAALETYFDTIAAIFKICIDCRYTFESISTRSLLDEFFGLLHPTASGALGAEYTKARAAAVGTLVGITCAPGVSKDTFSKEYLAQFYGLLMEGLGDMDDVLLCWFIVFFLGHWSFVSLIGLFSFFTSFSSSNWTITSPSPPARAPGRTSTVQCQATVCSLFRRRSCCNAPLCANCQNDSHHAGTRVS